MIELFEHNKTAYEAVCEQLEETGKACVVHPTGTGKSFIAFKWAEDNPGKRFLWLSPSENIFDTQLENVKRASGFEPENIEFMTYARLANLTDDEMNDLRPDGIVFDEAHRTGASVWQTGVERLLSACPNTPILGLTATPVRYLDNQRDMSEELFDGCVADSMTLGEAIARGILPAPKYVISLYTVDGGMGLYDQELHNYRDRIRRSSAAIREKAEEYLEKLRRALEKAEGLDAVFAKHLTRGKYIAFCANIEHMHDMVKKAPQWFSGVDAEPHVYSVWADSPSARDDYAAFRADESDHLRLMYCVDMFNEGIHVEDIDGVILFRPTISPIIYKQQIGRALSAMKGGTPLIIDAVNNFDNLYSISSIQAEMREIVNFYRNSRREDEIEADTFQIIDEVCECRQLISQLEETLSLSWELMYREAKAYFEEHGDLDLPRRYKTPEGIPLGQWVFSQRAIYNGDRTGLLNEQRIALLDAIGMNWSYARDSGWENGFEHAKAYKALHGDLLIPATYICEDGFKLGIWINNQRTAYMKLRNAGTDVSEVERFKQLEAIGMVWNRADMAFEEGIYQATRYAAEHGNLDMAAQYVTPDGYKLGQWIVRMRRRYQGYQGNAPLSEEQIARLEAIGMKWDSRHDQRWERCFDEAERYYKAHGDLAVPTGCVQNGFRLDRWLQHQREDAKAGRMSEDRLERLKGIGFSIVSRNKSWDDNYDLAAAYFKEHGNLEVPATFKAENGVWLGRWLAGQRLDKKRGKLTDMQIKRLDAIGMRWEDARFGRWDAHLEAVRVYPRNPKGVPIVPADAVSEYGTGLKLWVEQQDRKYRQGKLSAKQAVQWKGLLLEGSPLPLQMASGK